MINKNKKIIIQLNYLNKNQKNIAKIVEFCLFGGLRIYVNVRSIS